MQTVHTCYIYQNNPDMTYGSQATKTWSKEQNGEISFGEIKHLKLQVIQNMMVMKED